MDNEFTPLYLRDEDRWKDWRKDYRKLPRVKINRMARLYKKIKDGREKLDIDNKKGMQYESGMAGPHSGEKDERVEEKEDNTKQVIRCSHCKSDTHQRRTSKLCSMNPKKLFAKEQENEKTKLRECKSDTLTDYVEISDAPVSLVLTLSFILRG